MLLRSSISNTKKFFQKTLKNFKSFFSPGYQRLPKTPPRDHFSCSVAAAAIVMDMNNNNNNNPSYKNLEQFYSDFTEQWDSEKEKARGRRRGRSKKKAVPVLSSPAKQEKEVYNGNFNNWNSASPVQKKNQMEKREACDNQNNERNLTLTHQGGRHQDSSLMLNSMGVKREHRNCMVERKLRELEMLDMSNVDHVLDIEEVLHYYSRLSCPAYLEIVDKFFVELCSEFFGPVRPARATPRSGNSRQKLRTLRS